MYTALANDAMCVQGSDADKKSMELKELKVRDMYACRETEQRCMTVRAQALPALLAIVLLQCSAL